jgi:hypothetical protein
MTPPLYDLGDEGSFGVDGTDFYDDFGGDYGDCGAY